MSLTELFSLSGKTAVVTGGSRGIGAMIARGLLDAGASVLISARKEHELAAAKEELSQFGEIDTVRADLSTMEGVAALAAAAAAHFPTLNILVNNAGATWGMPLDEFDEHAWDKVMDTNVKGLFFLTQQLLPQLRAAGTADDPARVINIGSIDGLHVNPMDTYSYAASKAGVHHLTRSLAAEWAGRNVRVNAVAPTYIETELTAYVYEDPEMHRHWIGGTPMGRMGRTDEIASVVLFLASDASSLMTGSIVLADGGYTCW